MGLRSWLRARRNRSPRPPWVRPEFLTLFALLVASSAGAAYWAWHASEAGAPAPQAQTRHAYVGIDPYDVHGLMACMPDCRADERLAHWVASHPEADVLRVTPRLVDGVLVGYDVEYR